ncbi:GNAT family N-acetyltransferase [Rhodobacterales bacterium HKCCE2091]|nr:GNAT family N-acetyltransferase [Rhodobacterales bacterium HKCCE2091]
MTELRTERLVLRRFRAEDAAPLFEIFRDPRAMHYWSHLPHTDLAQTARFVERTMTADPATGDDFVVVRDGAVIGKCGAWHLPEVGILLHPDHWGAGIGREALRAVIAHLFATRDVAELTADIDPDNVASVTLFERLGFRRTGYEENTVKLGDRWCHSVYLALSREDWAG